MENKETLIELFNNYSDEIYKRTERQNEIGNRIIKLETQLYESLTEKQKHQIQQLQHLHAEREQITHRDIFVYAYSLANRLMIESLQQDRWTITNP